jgi:uncharacterized protein YcbX
MHLAAINIYPLKSCRGLPLPHAAVEPRGLQHDRRWLAVDADGRFITGRAHPRLVLVRAVPRGDGLHLSAPGMPEIEVATPGAGEPRRAVRVWDDTVDAACADPAADRWISAALGVPAHLVWMDAMAQRAVSPTHSQPGDEVSFADGYPLLLIGEGSLNGLNQRLPNPVPMARFRPNLVITGASAHAEDGWRRVRIGEVPFDVVKPCVRCIFTTVDTDTGIFDPAREPLNTLLSYRRSPKGVTFGMNLIARARGRLREGDPVVVEAAV